MQGSTTKTMRGCNKMQIIERDTSRPQKVDSKHDTSWRSQGLPGTHI